MRPERDELDRFKHRKEGSKARSNSPSPQAGTPTGSVALRSEPPRKPVFLSFMVFVLLLACAALAWAYWQQQQKVADLQADLADATGFISQSKLLMARLEGELSQTGEELEQSGSAAQSRLKVLDSEVRKLWGVANDRNKKAIKDNKEQAASLKKTLASQSKQAGERFAALEKDQKSFEKLLGQQQGAIKDLRAQLALSASEMAITRESLSEDLAGLQVQLKPIKQLAAQTDKNQRAIASIDSARRQLNERLVSLERALNAMQSKVPAAPAKPGPTSTSP